MIEFLKNNLGTIIVLLVVVAIIALVIIRLIKNKKSGKSSCGCGCEHCENSKYCHKTESK